MNKRSNHGILYDGVWFNQDKKTGYFLNTNKHIRLHRYIWEKHFGKIPKGYTIHHKDHNKSNNDIGNLELLTVADHHKRHAEELSPEMREWYRQNLADTARPAASKWHRSTEGREWHRANCKALVAKTKELAEKTCRCCGKKFLGNHHKEFCSNACKSKWRRKTGVDNIEMKCSYCGKTFLRNKYAVKGAVYCSKSCSSKSRL